MSGSISVRRLENFLLVPRALNGAVRQKSPSEFGVLVAQFPMTQKSPSVLKRFSISENLYRFAVLANRRRFERAHSSQLHDAQMTEMALDEFEERWRIPGACLELVPGKEALSVINKHAQDQYGVSITAAAIVDAMRRSEIPQEMVELVGLLVKEMSRKYRLSNRPTVLIGSNRELLVPESGNFSSCLRYRVDLGRDRGMVSFRSEVGIGQQA